MFTNGLAASFYELPVYIIVGVALGFILLLVCAILANILKLITFERIDEVDVLQC